MIGSHIIYKINNEENEKRLKARLCPPGNRDCEKGNIRNDSAAAQFNVIRLLLSHTIIFDFTNRFVDVKGSYVQSGKISRETYVPPPHEIKQRNVLWKLCELSYGISEAGPQWKKALKQWMTT